MISISRFFNLSMVARISLGSLFAGCIEFLVMIDIDNLSNIIDAMIVSGIFFLVVSICVIPEVKEKLQLKKERDSFALKHSEIMNQISRQTSLEINNVMFENIDDAVLITDKDNRIITVNPAFTRLTGYSINEVLGKNPSFLKSGETTKETYQDMWSSLNTSGRWSGVLIDRSKDGSTYKKFIRIYTVKERGKVVNYIGIFFNADERDEENQKYVRLAMYDNLTGIPNRNLFFDRVKAVFDNNRANNISAIMFIDLDNFKNINDVYGHQYGDYVLKEASRRISGCLRQSDTVARLGGDEFSVILQNIKSRLDAGTVAGKIIAEIEKPIYTESFCFKVSCSIGIAISHDDGATNKEIIQHADLAMYKAKELGKGKFEFFNEELKRSFVEKVHIESGIPDAIKNGEFFVLFQPQVDVSTGMVCGIEALVRWVKDGKVISPAQFIPTAEKSRLIVEIDKYVFNKVVGYIQHEFKQLFKDIGYEFRVSVNISASTLNHIYHYNSDDDYVQKVILENPEIAKYLEFEITETTLMKSKKAASVCINKLRDLGIHTAIDDFGTGQSSLAYIHELHVDKIKIDRSFIVNESERKKSSGIISFIQQLASSISAVTVAEGVETNEQLEIIKKADISSVQGYIYSKPIDVDSVYDYVKRRALKHLKNNS